MKSATRPLATRWIAAGSSAAVLAAGLLLSAPAAHATEGDPACTQASTQLATALGATGLTEAYLAQLEAAPVEAAPVSVNEEINMQTAVAAEHDQHPGPGLLAGLLAGGVAVSVAAFARTHRIQQRHQH